MIGQNWIELSWGGMTVNEKIARLENNVEYLKGQIPDGLKDTLIDIENKIEIIKLGIEEIKKNLDITNKNVNDTNNNVANLTTEVGSLTTEVGDLSKLFTADKTSIVSAINEVYYLISVANPLQEVSETDEVLFVDITFTVAEGGNNITERFYKTASPDSNNVNPYFNTIASIKNVVVAEGVENHIITNYRYELIAGKLIEYQQSLNWRTDDKVLQDISNPVNNLTVLNKKFYGYKKLKEGE